MGRWKMSASGSIRLESAAQGLAATPEQINRAAWRAVNKVADKTATRAKKRIYSTLNLRMDYIGERMAVRGATPGRPEAVIVARRRATTLRTYGAKQVTANVKKRKGAKGDPLRGIPAGRKAAGVSVSVKRGTRKRMPGAFLIPLRNDNGLGVFVREGSTIRHLYGPSVSQAFRLAIDHLRPEIDADLIATFDRQLAFERKSGK